MLYVTGLPWVSRGIKTTRKNVTNPLVVSSVIATQHCCYPEKWETFDQHHDRTLLEWGGDQHHEPMSCVCPHREFDEESVVRRII